MKRKENEYIVRDLANPLCLNHNRAIVTDSERLAKIYERNASLKIARNEIVKCVCGIEHTVGRTEQHKKSLRHRRRNIQDELEVV